jgi:hypothetical protein
MLCLFFFNSCASYLPGHQSSLIDGDQNQLVVSTKIDEQVSTENYTMFYFYFSNPTNEWIDVKKVKLYFKDKNINQKTQIVLGQRLSAWIHSMKFKISVDQWNQSIFLASLGLAGGIMMSTSSNSSHAKVGGGVFLSSTGAQMGISMMNVMNDIERSKMIPENHLYRPFSIPKGLFTKKWILLEIDKELMPNELMFELEFNNGKKSKHMISLKNVGGGLHHKKGIQHIE